MLFDLRSRGRRRTVQAVYLGLALLMGGGLVLFGVGAGNGFGGLLNAFTGNGGGTSQKQTISQDERNALRATQLRPNDPTAWESLVAARWTSAGQGANVDPTTGSYTAAGKNELTALTQAWQKYLTLTKNPDPTTAILAARAYGKLGNYAGEASAWEIQTQANPNAASGFVCLAASAYAANQTRKADLAAQKALSMIPQASRASLRLQLASAKSNPALAQNC